MSDTQCPALGEAQSVPPTPPTAPESIFRQYSVKCPEPLNRRGVWIDFINKAKGMKERRLSKVLARGPKFKSPECM